MIKKMLQNSHVHQWDLVLTGYIGHLTLPFAGSCKHFYPGCKGGYMNHKQRRQYYLSSVLKVVIRFAQTSGLAFRAGFWPGGQVKQSQSHAPLVQT